MQIDGCFRKRTVLFEKIWYDKSMGPFKTCITQEREEKRLKKKATQKWCRGRGCSQKKWCHSLNGFKNCVTFFLFYFFLFFYEKVYNSGWHIWKPLKFWGLLDVSISNTASSLRFYTGLKLMAYTGFYWVIETVRQKFQLKWFQQINLQKRCYGS